MKKPLYQVLVQQAPLIIVAAGFLSLLVAVIDSFSKITLVTAIVITITLILGFISYSIEQKKWVGADGIVVRIKQVSKKQRIIIFIFLSLIWIPALYNLVQRKPPGTKFTENIIKQKIFDSADKRLKILVVPFDRDCEYQGKKYDIGKVIVKRLALMNIEDTLGLVAHYLADFTDLSNFSSSTADSLMRFHQADQIIYGFYSLKECETGLNDKVCFNYRTNLKDDFGDKRSDTSLVLLNMSGLESLRNGFGQENIDYVIYMMAGFSAIKTRDFDRALRRFQQIGSNKEDAGLERNIGYCYFRKRRYKEAEKYLQNSILIDPQSDISFRMLGMVHLAMKMPAEAKGNFLAALSINPEADVSGPLGMAYLELNDKTTALKYFGKDSTLLGMNNLAGIYMAFRQPAEAMKLFQKILVAEPANVEVLIQAGKCYQVQNDHKNAMIFFQKALCCRPKDYDTWFSLGKSYVSLIDLDNAKIAFEKSVIVNPRFTDGWVGLGLVNIFLLDTLNAEACIRRAIKIDSMSVPAWRGLAQFYLLLKNDPCKAIESYEKEMSIEPYFQTYIDIAIIHSKDQQKRPTLVNILKAVTLAPTIKSQLRTIPQFKWLRNDPDFITITK